MQAVSRQAALGAGCNEQCVMISRPSHTRPGAVPGQGIGGVLLFDVGLYRSQIVTQASSFEESHTSNGSLLLSKTKNWRSCA